MMLLSHTSFMYLVFPSKLTGVEKKYSVIRHFADSCYFVGYVVLLIKDTYTK